MRTVGLLLLTVGWVITSERSRLFFQTNLVAYRTMLGAIVALWVIHIGLSVETLSTSKNLMTHMQQLNYIDLGLYEAMQLQPPVLVGQVLFTSVLFVALFMLVRATRRQSPSLAAGVPTDGP